MGHLTKHNRGPMELDTVDFFNLSKILGGFLYGVYSGIFALYLHYAAKRAKKGTKTTILFYALCVLYVLSGVVMNLDNLVAVFAVFAPNLDPNFEIQLRIDILQPTIFGCCDFIAQSILIYRCWIIWSYKTRVVIIPIIMALLFLGVWMAAIAGDYIASDGVDSAGWSTNVTTTSLVMSMTVNALVTSLIAFRIFKTVKSNTTFYENFKALGVAGGRHREFRYIMFVIIESGMILFSVQLARVVSTALRTGHSKSDLIAFNFILSFHEILNGIIPTIILVRVSMGLSFDDETSWKEAADSLRFVANDPLAYSIPELRSIHKENDISICEIDDSDIQMSDRRSASETLDKSIELKDTGSSIQKLEDVDSVESV